MAPRIPGVRIALVVPLPMDPGARPRYAPPRGARHGACGHHRGIRVTAPTLTLVDLAARWDADRIGAAISEADKRDVARADDLRVELETFAGVPGVATLRRILDRHTFTLTDSHLERLVRPIARRAGLGLPETRKHLNGIRVDFFFPERDLVVECDGLRYHRTAAQQNEDLRRDQEHWAAGHGRQRFSHAQIRYQAARVSPSTRTRTRLQDLRTQLPGDPST